MPTRVLVRTAVVVLGVAVLALSAGCSHDYRVTPVLCTERNDLTEWDKPEGGLKGNSVRVLNPYTYNPIRAGSVEAETSSRDGNVGMLADDKADRSAVAKAVSSAQKKIEVRSDVRGNSLYQIAADPSLPMTQRQEARNELVNAIIRVSDENAASHLAALKATQSNINVFLGAAALGLSGAGAAVSGGSQALSAASTGVQGARTLINDEVYAQALAESIITLVMAERKVQAEAIRQRYSEDLLSFPVNEAIARAAAYHETASAYNGLALARQAIEKDAISRRGDTPDRTTSLPDSIAAAEADLESAKRKLTAISNSLVTTSAELESLNTQMKVPDLETAAKAALQVRKQQLEQEIARLTAAKKGMETIVKEQQKEVTARKTALRNQLDADIKSAAESGTPSGGAGATGSGTTSTGSGESERK